MSGLTDEHATLTLDEAMFLLNDACGQRVVVQIETSTDLLSSSRGTLRPWTSGLGGFLDPGMPPGKFLGFYSIEHGDAAASTINVHQAVSAYWLDDDDYDDDSPRLAFDLNGDTTLIVRFCRAT